MEGHLPRAAPCDGFAPCKGRPELPLNPTHSPSQLLRSTLDLVHVQDEETEVTPSVEYIESEATYGGGRPVQQPRARRVNLHAHVKKIPRTGVEPVTFSM